MTVGETTYWIFTLAMRIPGLGQVRLVISFEKADLTGTYAVLVTSRVDWTARRVIATYLLRWPIETFYQDGKEHLGLDEYRMRDAEAIQKHWCLVFVAYSLLHLDCLPPSLTKSRLPIKTIGELRSRISKAYPTMRTVAAQDSVLGDMKLTTDFDAAFEKVKKYMDGEI